VLPDAVGTRRCTNAQSPKRGTKTQGIARCSEERAGSFGAGSLLSVGSVGSILSVLSIGSAGSILSIGSSGSILCIGSAGETLRIGGREKDEVDES
jgi:hypothetical protein